MIRMILLLVLSSTVLFSQSNVAFINADISSSAYVESSIAMSITSFELAGGLVVVKASIDGQKGDFILDTGAPGIILNSNKENVGEKVVASGVGGEIELREVNLAQFEWGMIQKSNFKGLTLDLSHLEETFGRDFMGLIGFEVLQNYELLFDYQNKMIRMYDAKRAHDIRPKGHDKVVPFYFNGHLPLISTNVAGRRILLGLDSGAEVNLLDDSYYRKLRKHLKKQERESVRGLDKKNHLVNSALIEKVKIKGVNLEGMRYLFLDLDSISSGAEVQGILGFPFFAQHTISINYFKKKVYIWK